MKYLAGMMIVLGLLLTSVAALADADDNKWIAECIKDNADAKVPTEVIIKYCACMNNKMSSNETLSITQWEKTHPVERADCDRQAGWK